MSRKKDEGKMKSTIKDLYHLQKTRSVFLFGEGQQQSDKIKK